MQHPPGNWKSKPFYFLDLETNTWSEGHKLRYPSRGTHIGLVTRPSGEKEIVFVGGKLFPTDMADMPADTNAYKAQCGENWGTKRVEIYNIANNTMRMGMYRAPLIGGP